MCVCMNECIWVLRGDHHKLAEITESFGLRQQERRLS